MSGEPERYGALLRRYRLEAALSIEDLARKAGLNKDTIVRHEQGLHTNSFPDTIQKLIHGLGLTAEQAQALRHARVAQLGTPGSAATPRSTPLTGAPVSSSIPSTPTGNADGGPGQAIVDRVEEVATILAYLGGDQRLLTLTGAPGVGKSRLAAEVARRVGLATATPDEQRVTIAEVVALDCALHADATLVAPAIAAAVGLDEGAAADLPVRLGAHLRERRLLLVLDNLDHALEAAPLLVGLVGSAPHLRVLATSRGALRVTGERDHPVLPLAPPAARELFVARASDIAPDAATMAIVDAICARVDHLPLAIELVAARLRLLTLPGLLAGLKQRLPQLAYGSRDLPARHRTMRAAIAWSHDLLDPDTQAVLRRLALFAGGWTLDAAEAVCGGGAGLPAPGVVVAAGLEGLIDAGFIRMAGTGTGRRFAMLGVIREFAHERLEDHGEAAAIGARHAEFALALATTRAAAIDAGDPAGAAGLDPEAGNLRAALDRLIARGDADRALRLVDALAPYWRQRGRLTEGRRALALALAIPGGAPRQRSRALHAASHLALLQGDDAAARELAEGAVALHRAAAHLRHLGTLVGRLGDHARAQELYLESMRAAAAAGDAAGLGAVANMLGSLARDLGMPEEAEATHALAHDLAWGRGDRRLEMTTLLSQGQLALDAGDVAAARWHFDDALALARDLDDVPASADAAALLGIALLHGGDLTRANKSLRFARRILRRLDNRRAEVACLIRLGTAALLAGDSRRAAFRHRAGLRLAVADGDGGGGAEALEGLAAVAVARGDGVRAARLLGTAAATREAAGFALTARTLALHEDLVGRARGLAGATAYDIAFAAGRGLTPAQILADGD